MSFDSAANSEMIRNPCSTSPIWLLASSKMNSGVGMPLCRSAAAVSVMSGVPGWSEIVANLMDDHRSKGFQFCEDLPPIEVMGDGVIR